MSPFLPTHFNTTDVMSPPIHWGAIDPLKRGPIIGTLTHPHHRNAIGTHAGPYTIYRALAIAQGHLNPAHGPDLTNTEPMINIGPYPSWGNSEKIVTIDPFGAIVGNVYQEFYQKGYHILPTIAITKGNLHLPELTQAIEQGQIKIDGKIIKEDHSLQVVKVAIDPVWYLPGIAHRLNIEETHLRQTLWQQTGGMYPDLISRNDLKVFLPPIGGITVYLIGDLSRPDQTDRQITLRIHDECNGSDVFGSDICTCRPYLIYGIELGIKTAQTGGTGIIVYFRKEGRAFGEVTKFLVYNARQQQTGGDRAATYFTRTECVAGAQDIRFQELMPDVLHWLGIQKIDNFVSMSSAKYTAIIASGIEVINRIPIPDALIPQDAQVEITAKKASGYF